MPAAFPSIGTAEWTSRSFATWATTTNLEVRYFGINNWTAFQRFVTTTPAEIPVTPPVPIVPIVLPPEPQQAPPNVTSRFDTNLYNAEVNWHHESSDTMGWLAGFRWMQVHDALGITTPDRAPFAA